MTQFMHHLFQRKKKASVVIEVVQEADITEGELGEEVEANAVPEEKLNNQI